VEKLGRKHGKWLDKRWIVAGKIPDSRRNIGGSLPEKSRRVGGMFLEPARRKLGGSAGMPENPRWIVCRNRLENLGR
jgi:hypothetical protein